MKAEIKRALIDGGIIEMDGVSVITEERDILCAIERIERVVRKVVGTADILFSLERKTMKLAKAPPVMVSTHVGKLVLGALKTDFYKMKKYFPCHVLNPYVDAFIRRVKKFKLKAEFNSAPFETVEQSVKVFNCFVGSLRKRVLSDKFKKKINSYNHTSNKNFKGMREYINALFERYARLLVVRVDLSYENKYCGSYKSAEGIACEQVRVHRERLLYDLKNKLFSDSMVGYVWKLEYGLSKGYHYHLLVFFDGSLVREDETLAFMIGRHWREVVSDNKGIFHNCNAEKEGYRKIGFGIGIGMINHDDYILRKNLERAAAYLTKTDYYIRTVIPDNGRTFGKGGKPKPKNDRRGRPRKATAVA
ncbi:hypothetical protein BLL42_17205 [Pseudomonas frederiksbergensis]|uniref:YagK/YfjJ C-terminal domain-containing protein n=1 Tax=Pseudomonas frederiksbergensis TaxID=104087 RepID=A0A1J0EN49_9PSED|nr:inovirus-type Gp2 protein [Pseudomonas frederiksbergensis]APC17391.1 hypothetical protein BLL42_17205 [Pseudomonas frederiksbergensis]